MTGTMTWVGLDVHARSTHAAAIDRESGELTRARFGAGAEPVVAWLQALPPVHACYEAGPTGYALYRAAEAAGLRVQVVAPSKTPRAAADRVKTDRKDAELLVRLLLAGSLAAVAVPPASFEAARDLARAASRCAAISLVCATASRSCCFAAGASTTAAAPGRRRIGAGSPANGSSTSRPSSPTSTRSPRSRGCSPAAPHSTSGFPARGRAGALADRRAAALLPRDRDALGARPASRDRRLRPLPTAWPTRRLARSRPLSAPVGRERDARADHEDRLRLRPPHPGRGRLALPTRAADRRHATRPRTEFWHPTSGLARSGTRGSSGRSSVSASCPCWPTLG
jgi:hypothetical protein